MNILIYKNENSATVMQPTKKNIIFSEQYFCATKKTKSHASREKKRLMEASTEFKLPLEANLLIRIMCIACMSE